MLFYSILFYSILFYSILFYSILFYSILFYSLLFYSILFYSILFYSILLYYILFYSILFYSNSFYSILNGIKQIFWSHGLVNYKTYVLLLFLKDPCLKSHFYQKNPKSKLRPNLNLSTSVRPCHKSITFVLFIPYPVTCFIHPRQNIDNHEIKS
jgi:hypothetical protein